MNWMLTYFVVRMVIVGAIFILTLLYVKVEEYDNLYADFVHCKLFDAAVRKRSHVARLIAVAISFGYAAETIVHSIVKVEYEAVAVMGVPLFGLLGLMYFVLFAEVVEKTHDNAKKRNQPKMDRLKAVREREASRRAFNAEFNHELS